MTTEEFLKDQLDILQKFHPAYGSGLSIHLPMALIALYRLGANQLRLDEYFKQAIPNLILVDDPREVLTDQSAREKLGTGKYYSEYRRFFKEAILDQGYSAVLKKWLSILAPGIGAHAFHSLIRLAYAIDIQHLEDIASSLAYWSDMYLPLGENNLSSMPEKDLGTFLHWIRSEPEFNSAKLSQSSIHIKMKEISKQSKFQKVLGALKVEDNTLSILADITSRWYLCTGDFTALHGVTSCHALAILLPYANDPEKLIRYYWQALCAAYLTVSDRTLYQGTHPFDEWNPLPDWEAIRLTTLHKRDEHDVKLVYSCWREQERYESLIYRKIASDRVGLTAGFWKQASAKC